MAAAKSSRVNRKYKTKYRVRNWKEYECGLRNRGDVAIWLSQEAVSAWTPAKNGLRGRPAAILEPRALDRVGKPTSDALAS